MRAYDHIVEHAREYHLQLRVDKCSVYLPPADDTPVETRRAIEAACASRQLKCLSQMELLGVMLGTDDDVRAHLTISIDQHQKLFECLRHPAMPVQIGYALLRWCALPRLSYLARTTDPMVMIRPEMAPRFDLMVTSTFKAMMKVEHDPITHEQITLPISRGGMGLRPVWSTSASAYFSSLASIMPEFASAFPTTDTTDAKRTIEYEQTKVTRELDAARVLILESHKVAAMRAAATTGEIGVLQVPTSVLWQKAIRASEIGTDDALRTFLESVSVQEPSLSLIDECRQSTIYDTSTPYRQVLLTSLTAPHASDWLMLIPTEPKHSLTDEAVRLATRHRLGLLPSTTLVGARCACQAQSSFDTDPDHFHSCTRYRALTVTQRHHQLIHTLAELGRSVGFHCIVEPNLHVRPEKPVGSITVDEEDHYNQHADLLLMKGDQKLYVDVCVTRPTHASNLTNSLVRTRPSTPSVRPSV